MTLDVPRGDGVTYAYISYDESKSDDRKCDRLKIEQQRVSFSK